jgi:hypothetical protein
VQRMRVAQSVQRGSAERVGYRARRGTGWYYLQVKMGAPGDGEYQLNVTKTPPPR